MLRCKLIKSVTLGFLLSLGVSSVQSQVSGSQTEHKMNETSGPSHDMGHHGMEGMHGYHHMISHPAAQPNDGAFHHRFDGAEKWAEQFDKPERDTWQKPDQVIEALKLPKNAIVADVGAGTGYFSSRIAKVIPEGKVYSADVEQDMVRYLGERAKKEGLININPIQANEKSPNLPEPVDVIMFVDTYHHIGNRVDYYRNLKSSLKPDGRLVIIDFREESKDGPPKAHRIPLDQSSEELKRAGFILVETFNFLPQQYFAVFKKSSN